MGALDCSHMQKSTWMSTGHAMWREARDYTHRCRGKQEITHTDAEGSKRLHTQMQREARDYTHRCRGKQEITNTDHTEAWGTGKGHLTRNIRSGVAV